MINMEDSVKSLADFIVGSKLTVHKVTGGKKQVLKMEAIGIMRGSDITVLDVIQSEDLLYIYSGSKELSISRKDAELVLVTAQFTRGKNDPIFLGGCCAYGNTADIWDRINALNQEENKHEV